MATAPAKSSYTIPCASAFRDAVTDLAVSRGVNAGDLARSVLILLPRDVVETFPDPGEPAPTDRETVVIRSGTAQGRPWRRKPRLQVRAPPGLDTVTLRRALGLALALDGGGRVLEVGPAGGPDPAARAEELERLRTLVSFLGFEPLADGVRSREEALYVLGFPPGAKPRPEALKARYRMLATIHHPDSTHGSTPRMGQINAAMDLLRLRRRRG